LEGIASAFRSQYDEMLALGVRPRARLVGAGNGIRRNPLLGQLLSEALALPIVTPLHAEEAAFGAALVATVAVGELPGLAAARRPPSRSEAPGPVAPAAPPPAARSARARTVGPA